MRHTPEETRQEVATTASATSAVVVTDAERRLKAVLRAGAALMLALIVAAAIGTIDSTLREPPWIGSAVAAGGLMALLAIYAAGEPRRRRGLTWILVATLLTADAALAAFAIADRGSTVLIIVIGGIELVLAAVIAAAALAARRDDPPPPSAGHWPSAASSGLNPFLLVLAALATAAAVLALIPDDWAPLLAAHAAAGALGTALLCLYVVADIRERLPLAGLPAVALIAGAVVQLAIALPLAGHDRGALLAGAGAALAIATVLLLLRRAAARGRLRPKFLGSTEYRTLMALADVIVRGPDEALPVLDIARNVDGYFSRIRAQRRWVQRAGLVAMQLHPLLYLKAPFSELDEETRLEHLKTHFQREVLRERGPDQLRRFVQAIIRVANQLAYIGYYSDRRASEAIGYEPFEKRARFGALDRAGKIPTPGEHPLKVTRGADLAETELDADVCIVGSGAAGAVLAHHLVGENTRVVVLERGEYVQPREFNSDEVEMVGRLYGDGVFQQTEDFRFTVLQGSCVGGSTVVNNAVSIRTPDHVLERWNEQHGAGLDLDAYARSTAAAEKLVHIRPQDEGPANPDIRLNPSAPKFLAGVDKRRSDPLFQLDVKTVSANIDGCVGCGYCNIGCRYGKKLSMLETVLPAAQRKFGADHVRIVSECEVRRIVTSDGRARAVKAKLSDGRTLTVNAGKVVVAAGTIASSYLLQQSAIGRSLPIGRHVCFNMGAPLTAEFEEDLEAYDGLQISHVAVPPSQRGWVFETWWNPPVSQALNMPGWFETHYENMRRYRKLMAVGALVGTERNAWVGKALTGGPAIHYTPTSGDMRKLADGLTELGHILFEGGAKALMLNSWGFHRFTSPAALAELPAILADPSLVTLGTGHPQGGNALGDVLDESFRVRGYENLYVCDASVFPSSLTVNPQLTVMALADYAAPLIANGHP
jgi:choline dehydrogenase-like flavoprotein